MVSVCLGNALPVTAQTATDHAVSRPALVHLARQLVDSVDYNFERADNYMDQVHGRENMKAIPDGEILLMQIAVGGRYGLVFNQPVLGIKQGDDILLSLFDFVSIAQFAIDVKPAEKVAEGWYIRENKKFRLDAQAMTVTAEDRTYELAEGDVLVEDADILVRSAVLAKVFQFQGKASFRYQKLDIKTTEQKWPVIEKWDRLRRQKRLLMPPPSLPRHDDPYQLASVPNVDVSTRYDFFRSGDGEDIRKSRSHSAVMAGDMIGHTMRAIASGDQMHALQTLSATFGKDSNESNLLGPLKARSYSFGDVSSASVPGARGGSGGVGFRVTNRNPYITSDETTIIEGDVAPGWDVELYRGDQYIDVNVSSEGRYRFEEVYLTAGENKFRILKYGPLGEMEEEDFTIYSTPRAFSDTSDIYNASINAAHTVLWTRNSAEAQDKYTPIVAGTLEHRLNQDTIVKGGLHTSQQDGQQKTYMHGGGATYIEGAVLNGGLTADVDGALLGTTSVRRRLLGQDMRFGANYTTADYGVTGNNSTPSSYELEFMTRGALPEIFDYSLGSYSFNTRYEENSEGDGRQESSLSWSHRIKDLAFSHRLSHYRPIVADESLETEQSLGGQSSVMGTMLGTRWRASTEYSLDPENSINAYSLDLTRRLARNVRGQLLVRNEPKLDFTQSEARVIWNHENFTLAPGVSYNSDNDFGAFVTANFSLAYDPYAQKLAMSGRELTKSGGLSGFVYLDKDGDMTFSEGDEPIQDAVIEALHVNRSGATDENGETFIHDIPDNAFTDVKLSEYSLFDPLMVSATEGKAVLPRSGHTTRLEFPVHNGGELDGNVYIAVKDGKERSARNLRVHLHDMSGRLVQTANVSFDGFYLFQKIHPGQYWLLVDAKDAWNQRLIRPLPQTLRFGYEGTVIYAHKIVLRKADEKEHDVPTTIGEDYAPYLAANPDVNVKALKGNLVLNFGEYRSRALMSVVWYRLRMFNGGLIRGAQLLTSLAESNPAAETGLHSLRAVVPGLGMEDAWNRCYSLMGKGFACKVEMLPTGLDGPAQPEQQQALLTPPARG